MSAGIVVQIRSRAAVAAILIVIGCLVLAASVGSDTVTDSGGSAGLLTEEALKSNPSLGSMKWPSEEQVEQLYVYAVENSIVESQGRRTVARILRPECIPPDIVQRFIPLRWYVNGADALLARIEHETLVIELFVTSSNLRMLVREEEPEVRDTEKEKLDFVQGLIARLFNESDVILGADHEPEEAHGGLGGEMPQMRKLYTNRMPPEERIRWYDTARWYDTVRWWTDGQLAAFRVCKSPGSSVGFGDQKCWFALSITLESGLRGKKEPLTEDMIEQIYGVSASE